MLVEDKAATPAELAASRVDFPVRLQTLDQRDRKVALKLSEGESVSPSLICSVFRQPASQLRRELSEAWDVFHGELDTFMAQVLA